MEFISIGLALGATLGTLFVVWQTKRTLTRAREAVEALGEGLEVQSHALRCLLAREPHGWIDIPADEWQALSEGSVELLSTDDGVRVFSK